MEKKAKENQEEKAFNHKSDEFLIEHFKQSQEEMRWRKNVEFRLLQFTVVLYAAIAAAVAALYRDSIKEMNYSILTGGAIVLFILLTTFIHLKVKADHEAYEKIGEGVQRIWKYFGLFKEGEYLPIERMLPLDLLNSRKGYGKGCGYKKTLTIIWITAVIMAIFLVLLVGVTKFYNDWTSLL